MNFPGRIIKINEADTAIVQAIATRLGTLGYVSGTFAGAFDSNFKSLVALFQSQHVDVMGRALKADGEIGPVTWAAIFGAGAPAAATGSLAQDALAFASTQIGVMEQPVGSNKGPEVNAYLASVGVAPGNFWCMAFIHFCFIKAAKAAGMANTFPKTGSCVAAWDMAAAFRVTKQAAIANPALVGPGAVFVFDFGGGHGHTGFVKAASGGALRTVEGNSNSNGSSNGVGVFDLNRRNVMDKGLKGFIVVP